MLFSIYKTVGYWAAQGAQAQEKPTDAATIRCSSLIFFDTVAQLPSGYFSLWRQTRPQVQRVSQKKTFYWQHFEFNEKHQTVPDACTFFLARQSLDIA